MARKAYDPTQLNELLYQALEAEIGGNVVIDYAPTGLRCCFETSIPGIEADREPQG